MFVYSFRANTIKFFGVLCVALVALITLIAFLPTYEPSTNVGTTDKGNAVVSESAEVGVKTVKISYDKVKTNEDRIKFLEGLGWSVSAEPIESEEVVIPQDFDKVFAGYNEIQKSQGLDLGKYKKKHIMRYTYEVTNYEGYEGKVLANLLIYKNRVVGGDICSADVGGFLHGLEK